MMRAISASLKLWAHKVPQQRAGAGYAHDAGAVRRTQAKHRLAVCDTHRANCICPPERAHPAFDEVTCQSALGGCMQFRLPGSGLIRGARGQRHACTAVVGSAHEHTPDCSRGHPAARGTIWALAVCGLPSKRCIRPMLLRLLQGLMPSMVNLSRRVTSTHAMTDRAVAQGRSWS